MLEIKLILTGVLLMYGGRNSNAVTKGQQFFAGLMIIVGFIMAIVGIWNL